jgi:hypothetical protein
MNNPREWWVNPVTRRVYMTDPGEVYAVRVVEAAREDNIAALWWCVWHDWTTSDPDERCPECKAHEALKAMAETSDA